MASRQEIRQAVRKGREERRQAQAGRKTIKTGKTNGHTFSEV